MRFSLGVPALAAALVAPVLVAVPASAAGELRIVQLDMGQGDAALFRGPCGDVGLVDAGDGSADDIADQMLVWGSSAMSWAAAGHYDADHVGDIPDLTVDVPVVYDRGGGAAAKDTATYDRYFTFAEGREHIPVDIGDVLRLCTGADLVTFTVMSAGTDGTAADEVAVTEENDRGLCFHVEFGDFDMATCGDLNGVDDGSRTNVEAAVADEIGDVEVAKVNHHGSAYSSNQTYVSALQAEVALVSVGPNPYGHPTVSAVDRWRNSGSAVYLTGLAAAGLPASGDITVSTDGINGFAVQTQRSDAALTRELDEQGSTSPEPQPEPEPNPQPTQPTGPGTAVARAIDDSCPAGQFPEDGFVDVPASNVHETAIDCLVWWRVANGRNSAYYAPAAGVARDAMASFIARSIGADLTQPVPDAFSDDNHSVHQQAINFLAQAGIVGGTGGGSYSPSRIVTRGQMARFMANAAAWRLGAELPANRDFFDDDAGHLFERNINQVAEAGITGGRGDRAYVPDGLVTRDQMASFLARLLDLFTESGARQRPAAESQPRNPGDDVDCVHFASQGDAQRYYDHYRPYHGDVARLDADGDGIACEVDAPAPAPAPQQPPQGCHPDYVTCIPIKGDGSGSGEANDLDCADIRKKVQLRRIGIDPYRLDANNDGFGCESYG